MSNLSAVIECKVRPAGLRRRVTTVSSTVLMKCRGSADNDTTTNEYFILPQARPGLNSHGAITTSPAS